MKYWIARHWAQSPKFFRTEVEAARFCEREATHGRLWRLVPKQRKSWIDYCCDRAEEIAYAQFIYSTPR